MTGYKSKKAAAQDKLDDDDTQVYQDHDDALTIAYQSGYYDGKKAAQPAQEPVACIGTNGELMWLNKPRAIYSKPIPLYIAPPQRPWVGLTDEEINTTWKKWIGTERANKSYTLAIEDTLRSKNT